MTSPPKMYALLLWILGPSDIIPDSFIDHKSKLKGLVPYITEQVWTNFQLVHYLNKHINDLYNIPDPIDQLILLRKVFQNFGIRSTTTWKFIPTRSKDLIKAIEDMDLVDENTARSKITMFTRTNHLDQLQAKYLKLAATKANIKKTSSVENNTFIKNTLKKQEANNSQMDIQSGKYNYSRNMSSVRISSDITQQLVDEMELILFDVSLLKKRNEVLFIFIDKDNKKYYKIEPFVAEIYISKKQGVINNDYIELLNDNDYIRYLIPDVNLYIKLKYMLNGSYKRIVNGRS